jgi:hypothetical protein
MKNPAPELKMSAPTNRKRVIQISAIPESEEHSVILFALTDDGAIYSNIFNLTLDPPEWDGGIPVPPIPPNH